MSIADGRKIAIRFNQPLTGEISGNETKFTVSFDEYDYVPGGKLSRVTRTVTGIGSTVSLDRNLDLSEATSDGIEIAAGKLVLGVQEAEVTVSG